MEKCVYEPFFKNGGTPICCRSFDEVERLIQDMLAIFPEESSRLEKMKRVFGRSEKYQSEVVYRFSYLYGDHGGIYFNFCSYEWYKKEGYQIVEFSDILAKYGNDDEDVDDWELEDLAVLFT